MLSEEIKPTFEAYTSAYNYVCQIGYQDRDFNSVSLHYKTYEAMRKHLPAQLVCSARAKSAETLNSIKKRLKKKQKTNCPQSKLCSIRYDARSYNVWFDRNELSLLTVNGRKKLQISIPDYFKQYIGWKRTSADLMLRKNKVFLYIVFEKEIDDFEPNNIVVGIDRGINKLAVTSNNQFFSGKHVKAISHRYFEIRRKLQSCGTPSAKRHLCRISEKENRFRTDVNHIVSKQIVQS
ncbi:MAG: transposase, partial [Thermodesulfobium sp.]